MTVLYEDPNDISTAEDITIEELRNRGFDRATAGRWKLFLAGLVLRFRPRMRAQLYEDLAVYRVKDIEAEEALATIFNIITDGDTATGFIVFNPLVYLIPDWLHRHMEDGESYADVAMAWLPYSEARLFGTYAEQGLPGADLHSLSQEVRELAEWVSETRRNLTMPMLTLALLIGTVLYIVAVQLPPLLRSLPTVSMRGAAADAQAFGEFIRQWGWYCAAGLVAFIAGILVSLRRWTGPTRRIADHIFPYNYYCDYTSLNFLDEVGSHLSAKRDAVSTLELLRENATPYEASHIDEFILNVNFNPITAMYVTNTGWPRRRYIRSLRTLATGNNPGPQIKYAVNAAKKDYRQKLTALSTRVGFFVMIVISAMMLWMLQLGNSINESILPTGF